jgi:hypothetical protein
MATARGPDGDLPERAIPHRIGRDVSHFIRRPQFLRDLPEDGAHVVLRGVEIGAAGSRARRSITLMPHSSRAMRPAGILGAFGRRCLDLLYRMAKMRVSAICAASIVSGKR